MSDLGFKLKLPKDYISYSQMNLYLWDPKEYYEQYFLGKDFMAELKKTDINRWEKITLGSIFQDAWADPRVNWRRKLKDEGFTADKERVIATALEQENLLRVSPSKCERTYKANYRGIPILIRVDAFDEGEKLLIENKFGAPRDQENADEDNQISYYNLGIKLALGWLPKKNILQSVNDRTGKVKQIETKRTQSDLDHIGDLIVTAARGISEGVWEK